MKAILPLNITALRVNLNDVTYLTSKFKGATVRFDNLPYQKEKKDSSTGDMIWQPLENDDKSESTLHACIHLHWELPEYFKKGIQSPETGKIIFPQSPNRWLVTRYLCKYDKETNKWLPPTSYSWVVESDYISEKQQKDKDGVIKASVSVPLPTNASPNAQPYQYMGRVVDANEWPLSDEKDKYLKDFNDSDGNPLYLSAIGFIGATFSSYYPDCCSVFGFHDRFEDDPDICDAIKKSKPVRFKASYQIIGWIEGDDPCDNLKNDVASLYKEYVDNCIARVLAIEKNPMDFFSGYMKEKTGWIFNTDSITYTLDEKQRLESLEVPDKTICNGIIQEIVWDMDLNTTKCFLGKPSGNEPAIWEDKSIRLAIGNTSAEALSALLKADYHENSQHSFEYLLNMFQSGRIEGIGKQGNQLSRLKNGLHEDNFASKQGGLHWIMRKKSQSNEDNVPTDDKELPTQLYQFLDKLNHSQKEYDMRREALDVERKQFYMDWFRYIKIYSNPELSSSFNVDRTAISNFIQNAIKSVIPENEKQTGVLNYLGDTEKGVINAISEPVEFKSSKAYRVWENFDACRRSILEYPEWELLAIPAPSYQMPTDPVLAIEMDSLRCKMRNEDISYLPVRVDTEIPDRLKIVYKTIHEIIEAKELMDFPDFLKKISYEQEIKKLYSEASIIIPSLAAEKVATFLEQKKGIDIFTGGKEHFVTAFTSLLGGGSSIDAEDMNSGLFNILRQEDYLPVPNPQQAGIELTVTFTNAKETGRLMHPLGWNRQEQVPELHAERHDPFLPLSIVWKVKLEPVKRNAGNNRYSEKNISGYFSLDTGLMDYTYSTDKPITDSALKKFAGSSIMMKKAIKSVTKRIEKYASAPGNNQNGPDTESKINEYKQRKIISLTLSGFSSNNLSRQYIPSIPLMNLTKGDRDHITSVDIGNMLTNARNKGDNWYDLNFNTEAPISYGPSDKTDFCPLRGGFLSVEHIEIIDVFGQRMKMSTPEKTIDGSLQAVPSISFFPERDDMQHQGKAFLPPRLFTPSRLLFEWLDEYPQTACGWILPNHLDNSLFFYDDKGNAVGSFGIEHKALKYRTRAGNRTNPADSLEQDIGTAEQPAVNAWLARFMRYIQNKGAGSFANLMRIILESENFISPGNKQGDGSLAVLTGRPLAIARIALGIETYGATLPLNQRTMSENDPWPQDIVKKRYNYTERMKYGDAGLSNVGIPVWLGDHHNMDDGLIAYLQENTDDNEPYRGDIVNPASRSGKTLWQDSDTDVVLFPNATPRTFTVLIDPCAKIHALSGLLPAGVLEFPADNFTKAVKNLHMTFFTHPLLQQNTGLTVPLPEQKGYDWSWVSTQREEDIPLSTPYSSEDISWGYSPQTLEEGWLKLSKENEKDA